MRLFVAIDIPGELREELQKIQRQIPFARIVAPENLHVTIKFIGKTTDEQLKKVKKALAELQFNSFNLESVKLVKRNSMLWCTVKPSKYLSNLRQAVDKACLNFAQKDFHEFKPHITLARFGNLLPNELAVLQKLDNQRLQVKWKATEFVLYETKWDPLRYEVVERFV